MQAEAQGGQRPHLAKSPPSSHPADSTGFQGEEELGEGMGES